MTVVRLAYAPFSVTILIGTLIANLVFVSALAAEGATYWTRPDGTLSGCASSESPPHAAAGYMSTITAGVSCLESGDTLNVREGDYPESVDIVGHSGSPSSYTKIQRYANETVRISGGRTSVVGIGGIDTEYIQFDGFIIDGINTKAGPPETSNCLVVNAAQHIRITNNEIINCATTSIMVVPDGSSSGGNFNEFTGNIVRDNWWDKSYFSGNAFYIDTSHNIVERNLIYNIGGLGIRFMSSDGTPTIYNIARYNTIYNFSTMGLAGGGGILLGSENNIAHNNVIFGGLAAGIIVNYNRPRDNLIYNNTIYGNAIQGISIEEGSGAIVRNNIIYGNCTISCGKGIEDLGVGTVADHNLSEDPLFVNEGAHDFHLMAGSPAIGAGMDVGLGLGLDIGAYSLGAFAPPVEIQQRPSPVQPQ